MKEKLFTDNHILDETQEGSIFVWCPHKNERIYLAKIPRYCPMCGEKLPEDSEKEV